MFRRFHARPGCETDLEDAIRAVGPPTQAEPGCLSYVACRGTRDLSLFYIHSRWVDEAAFDRHATLSHTLAFIERAERLIDHPLDVTRAGAVARRTAD